MATEGLPVRLTHLRGAPPGLYTCHAMALDDIEALVLKVSFVDDGAIVITASVPATLKRRFQEISWGASLATNLQITPRRGSPPKFYHSWSDVCFPK